MKIHPLLRLSLLLTLAAVASGFATVTTHRARPSVQPAVSIRHSADPALDSQLARAEAAAMLARAGLTLTPALQIIF